MPDYTSRIAELETQLERTYELHTKHVRDFTLVARLAPRLTAAMNLASTLEARREFMVSLGIRFFLDQERLVKIEARSVVA
ncbi:hypothetical protein [Deinococcus peraridilitoris]|uniref:Uncharacterized protein n=1 Tax=Deinococcus peraridilitoris (strain DSM 19664 / LMG 22246 / CIP 109416 / KR-200) TaxID=937777 RepID=L0A820_DEIPD|nr:hypothetical protein [Deinococcus peraridilitoris]AFZ69195.1 hypothetical protein Deipe_3771 [Deinococcus peraridilitoris DSM 19664]